VGTVRAKNIKVLFVDNDVEALARIRSLVDASAEPWDVRYAQNGSEALTELEFHGAADVVVANQRMPIMDGATLLASVRHRYPGAVRIIVSDFRDLPTALRSLPVAHRFLETPVEMDALRRAVDTSVEVQTRIGDSAMQSLLGEIDVLPSPPAMVIELNKALTWSETSVADIARIVETDAAMTAKLLHLVNSAFFGLGHRVTSVSHAVSYLGLATVRNVLCAVELVRAFTPEDADLSCAVEQLHTHSLAVADLARSFMTTNRLQAQDAFVAGMIHDIGLLAIITCAPKKYRALSNEAAASGASMSECELEILGATHASVGAYLLNLWGLPYALVEAVAHSHDADTLPEPTLTPSHAVFVAEQVVNQAGRTPGPSESGVLPDRDYLERLGLADFVDNNVVRSR